MAAVYLYHYYFAGIQKPVIIQAPDKRQARTFLQEFMRTDPVYCARTDADIIGETVVEPVTGISERVIDGKKYLWAGIGHGIDGWLPETAFKDQKI